MAKSIVLRDSAHEFWECSERNTPEGIAAERGRILESLARFGFQTEGEPVSCQPGQYRMYLRKLEDGSSDNGAFKDRLESISASKLLWQERKGDYYERTARWACGETLFAIIVGITMAILSHPYHAWVRRFCAPRLRLSLSIAGPLRPLWFAHFDRWLLVRAPTLWAAQIHVLLLRVWWAVPTAMIIDWIAKGTMHLETPVRTRAFQALILAWPYLWLVVRRPDFARVVPLRWRPTIGSFFLGALLVPVLSGCLGRLRKDDDLLSASLGACACAFLVIGICIVRGYRGRLATLVMALIGHFLLAIVLFIDILILSYATNAGGYLSVSDGLAGVCAAVLLGAVVVFLGVIFRPSRPSRTALEVKVFFCAQLVFVTPGLICALWSLACKAGNLFTPRPLDTAFAVVLGLAMVYLYYFYALSPIVNVLAKSEYEPKPE
ncbi:MAG TPA: hypothetical protein VFK05_05605 [Polyangiaceae bacterium]|nr:hypothetical protein [Polyangiaceae bacterium]